MRGIAHYSNIIQEKQPSNYKSLVHNVYSPQQQQVYSLFGRFIPVSSVNLKYM